MSLRAPEHPRKQVRPRRRIGVRNPTYAEPVFRESAQMEAAESPLTFRMNRPVRIVEPRRRIIVSPEHVLPHEVAHIIQTPKRPEPTIPVKNH